MARSGTSAWLPKRPEEIPASGAARFARRGGDEAPVGRSTRPFRFGSEDLPDPDPALRAGTLVGGRYRIARLLGEGGMGRVYEAEHTVLQRRVALKLLRRDTEAAAENLARFQREALAASRIGAPQIVEIVDFDHHVGEGGAQTYMVMELLVGESLEDWMESKHRLDEGLELLAQLCDGLAAAHRAGVIHRDIKPANVFCCAPDPTFPTAEGPRVKILDFGIAKITAGGPGYQTQRGTVLGTPYYLAPERVMGEALSPAADIYSVGVILYELLTGTVPFVAESFMGILARHVRDPPLDPRQAAPGRRIPDPVASLTMRLLAKEPDARPDAEALAAQLRAMLAGERAELEAIEVGLASMVSGPGEDTQVFDEPEGVRLAERETVAPGVASSVSGTARVDLGLASAREEQGGRSMTAIGHASAAMSASTGSVSAAPEPEPGQPDDRAGRSRSSLGLVLGLVGGLALVAGAVGLSMRGAGGSVDRAAEQIEGPAGSGAEPAPPLAAEPGPDGGPARDTLGARAESAAGSKEASRPDPPVDQPAQAPSPEPESESSDPKPKAPAKAPKAGPKPAKPKPKPEPAPEPEAAPDPDPAPASGDSPLPTIKDDVYD